MRRERVMPRVRVLGVLAVLVAAGCLTGPPRPLPDSMTVIGDSISRGVNADSPGEHPVRSWATGDDRDDIVLSFAERVAASNPRIAGRVFNDARSGADMRDVAGQAVAAVARDVDLVLVLAGANDVCGRGEPTSPEAFREDFRRVATILREGLPTALVYVLSVPDLDALRSLAQEDPSLHQRWALSRACGGRLASDATDLAGIVDAYNRALAEESAARGFWFDDGAVHAGRFARAELSPVDAFHPSVVGQAHIADAAWSAGPYAG